MCGGHRRTCERLRNFSLSSLWEKKKWHRNKELTTVEFEPGTAGSETTELPTKPQGSWRVQLIEKAVCLWFLCPMMDLGKRRCLQVPTRWTAPVNGQRCVLILPPLNGGRDRALLQNDRHKFLNSFPFFFIPQNYCVTRIAIMVEAKNLSTLKASALVLSRKKPHIKRSTCSLGFYARFISQ